MGIVLFFGTVVQSGGGALGLAVQRGVVQSGGGALCFGAWWQLLEGDAAPVPDAWGQFGCAMAGDCQGGHG